MGNGLNLGAIFKCFQNFKFYFKNYEIRIKKKSKLISPDWQKKD